MGFRRLQADAGHRRRVGVALEQVVTCKRPLIPVVFLHFILAYLNSINKRLIRSLYALGTGFSLLALYPGDILIRGVSPISLFSFYPKAGWAYPFFLAFFGSCVLLGLQKLWRAYAVAPAVQRNQIRYLLLAMLIGFGGGTTAF